MFVFAGPFDNYTCRNPTKEIIYRRYFFLYFTLQSLLISEKMEDLDISRNLLITLTESVLYR